MCVSVFVITLDELYYFEYSWGSTLLSKYFTADESVHNHQSTYNIINICYNIIFQNSQETKEPSQNYVLTETWKLYYKKLDWHID